MSPARYLAPLVGVALALGPAAPARARTPLAAARRAPAAAAAALPHAEGLAVHLAEGTLTVTADVFHLDPRTRVEGVELRVPLATDAEFFRAPVTGMVRALLARADFKAARFKNDASSILELKDVRAVFRDGAFKLRGRKVVGLEARGWAAWNPETLRLVLEVEGVKAGIAPVPLRAVFATMKAVMTQPFVEVARPKLYVSLAEFLQ